MVVLVGTNPSFAPRCYGNGHIRNAWKEKGLLDYPYALPSFIVFVVIETPKPAFLCSLSFSDKKWFIAWPVFVLTDQLNAGTNLKFPSKYLFF